MEEDLDIYHVIDVLMCTFHLTIDRVIISTSVFDDCLIFKSYMYEARRVEKLSYFIRSEYGSSVSVVMEDMDTCFDELKWRFFGHCWIIKGVTVFCGIDDELGG